MRTRASVEKGAVRREPAAVSAPTPWGARFRRRAWVVIATLASFAPFVPATTSAAQEPTSVPVALAVLAFELEDVSAAGALTRPDAAKDAETMRTVTREARRLLAASGRYRLVDVDAAGTDPAGSAIWRCDGCDIRIARAHGAEQSLAGVVRRVAQTEYYVAFRLADVATGRVIDQQAAFFIGSDDAWKSGVRSLLRRSLPAVRPAN